MHGRSLFHAKLKGAAVADNTSDKLLPLRCSGGQCMRCARRVEAYPIGLLPAWRRAAGVEPWAHSTVSLYAAGFPRPWGAKIAETSCLFFTVIPGAPACDHRLCASVRVVIRLHKLPCAIAVLLATTVLSSATQASTTSLLNRCQI